MKVTVQSKEERRREAGKEGEKEREREREVALQRGAQLFLCKLSHLLKKNVKKKTLAAFIPSYFICYSTI